MELQKKIMDFLGSDGRPATTLEIAKAVGMNTRKEINPTLYQMQDRGMIEKVQEQPPRWKACRSNSNYSAPFTTSPTGRGFGRGLLRMWQPPPHPPQPRSLQQGALGKLHVQPRHPSSSSDEVEDTLDAKQKLLKVMKQNQQSLTALDLSKMVGLKRTEVNAILHSMLRERIVSKDDSRGAPVWRLETKSRSYSSSSSGSPTQIDQLKKLQLIAKQYEDTPAEDMDVDAAPTINAEVSKIPEDDLQGRIIQFMYNQT